VGGLAAALEPRAELAFGRRHLDAEHVSVAHELKVEQTRHPRIVKLERVLQLHLVAVKHQLEHSISVL